MRTSTILLLIWATVCILFFITLPGKETYVQWSNLALWRDLGAKLGRLSPTTELFNLLGSFAGMIVFCLACISLGAFVSSKLKTHNAFFPSNSHAVVLTTEFLIGSGVFSLIFLALAGLYQLTPAYVTLLISIGGLLGARQLTNSIPKLVAELSSGAKELFENKLARITVLLCVTILCLGLFYSTARISYDSSAIYFSNAKLTAINHRIQFFTGDSFIVSAFHNSIHYTALIQLFGDQSARMFSWFGGIIFIVFSMAIGRATGISRLGIVILLTLLLTTTAILDLMGDGKVDILTSAYAIAAVYWMVANSRNGIRTKFINLLIGFLAGFAMIGRPFNVFILGGFIILFYVQRAYFKKGFETLDVKGLLASFLYIGAGAIGLGLYHLFANWMIQGDPLAFLDSIVKVNPSAGPWDYDPNQILAIRLLYPFVTTFFNSPQTLGNISPLFVAFFPALLTPNFRKLVSISRELQALFVISLVTLLMWIFLFFTVYEIRYVLFLWAILFIPVAEVIAAILENQDQVLRRLSIGLLMTLLVFMIVRTIYIPLDTYSPIDKHGNPQCFCESLESINEAAAQGERVLTLSAFRYYLRTDLFACSTKHEEYKRLRDAARLGAKPFWLEVYRQGYKYILFETEYTTRHLELGIIPSPENSPEWLKLQPIFISPGSTHIAYRVDIKSPQGNAATECKLNASGIWQVQHSK